MKSRHASDVSFSRRHNMRKGLLLGFVAQCLLFFFYTTFFNTVSQYGAVVSFDPCRVPPVLVGQRKGRQPFLTWSCLPALANAAAPVRGSPHFYVHGRASAAWLGRARPTRPPRPRPQRRRRPPPPPPPPLAPGAGARKHGTAESASQAYPFPPRQPGERTAADRRPSYGNRWTRWAQRTARWTAG